MSFWSNNPELLDELTIKFLPEDWKNRVESGEIELENVPEKIRDKAMMESVSDYWDSLADAPRT